MTVRMHRLANGLRMVTEEMPGLASAAVGVWGTAGCRHETEAENGIEIAYSIPKEGTIIWFDMLAIPSDAPHPENAHRFIDYLLEPEVIAAITDYVYYANPNRASTALIDEEITGDPGIYPTDAVKAKLFPDLAHSARFTRVQTRAWTRFKTGQ